LSGHDDLSRIVAKKNIMCLNFINKYDNLKNNLKNSLELALSIVGKKRRVKYFSRGVIYNIEIDCILYITKETVTRNTIIVCDNNTYSLNMSMKNVISELPNEFVQVHRACYVNKKRVSKIDYKDLKITFDNNITINLVSKKYIEGLMK
jgi:DNA-binding LytR/AlgR family response regulator